MRSNRGPVVESVDWHAAGQDLKNHKEDVRGQVTAELDDGGLVVFIVQRQREDHPKRRNQHKRP